MTDYSKDVGCSEASEYLEEASLCRECPFAKCVKEMAASDRVLLKNSPVIKSLYKCIDMNMSRDDIMNMFRNVPKSTLTYWRKNRESIEVKIKRLEAVISPQQKKRKSYEPVRRQQREFATQGILPI